MTSYAKNIAIRGNVTSGMDQILDKPRASVYCAAGHNVPNSTPTAIIWNTLDYQSEGIWSTTLNQTRFTIITAGLYAFCGWIAWPSNATSYRQLYFQKNTTTVINDSIVSPGTGTSVGQSISAHIPCNAGDYVELVATQGTGGTLIAAAATATDRENGFQCCLIST